MDQPGAELSLHTEGGVWTHGPRSPPFFTSERPGVAEMAIEAALSHSPADNKSWLSVNGLTPSPSPCWPAH